MHEGGDLHGDLQNSPNFLGDVGSSYENARSLTKTF